MANTIMKWNTIGRSIMPDISCLPTRIEEIPKEILRMYGLVVDEENAYDSDASDEGVLVVDEGPQVKIHVDLTQLPVPNRGPSLLPSSNDDFDTDNKLRALLENQLNFCGVCKICVSSEEWEEHQSKCRIKYCSTCKKLVKDSKDHTCQEYPFNTNLNKSETKGISSHQSDTGSTYCDTCKKKIADVPIAEHLKMHCGQPGCCELISNESERAKHIKMHDHPTKPFACRWCKKRYHFYTYLEKHHKVCKAVRKTKESWKKLKGGSVSPASGGRN